MNEERKTLWGGHLIQNPAQQNVRFCAGRDVRELPMADELLLPFDIWTNRAHCIMLEKCRLIQTDHLKNILKGLEQLETSIEKDAFKLNPELEDVHTNVEVFVSEMQGADAGGRMHIGRSRNDQSACDTRLYLRSRSIALFEEVKNLGETLLVMAEEHCETVMPGFTHYQPAMITSWGHWLCAYVQGLCRDLERLVVGESGHHGFAVFLGHDEQGFSKIFHLFKKCDRPASQIKACITGGLVIAASSNMHPPAGICSLHLADKHFNVGMNVFQLRI
jgi:argininosuccinate lyase